MKKQTLLWTALPNGILGPAQAGLPKRLRLSILVSPRLQTDEGLPKPTLSQFPDFLDWPGKVKGAAFSVQFEGGPTIAGVRVSPEPETELWQALFKSSTYVRPYQFNDLKDRLIFSYPVKHVLSFLKGQYQKIATESAAELPAARSLVDPKAFGQIGFYREPQVAATMVAPDREAAVLRELQTAMNRYKAVPPRAQPNPPMDFFQAKWFHRPLNRVITDPVTKQPKVLQALIKIPEIDFHQMVSVLGKYGELLRRLGLVADLEVPLGPGIPAAARVRVVVTWPPTTVMTDISTPWTKYVLDEAQMRFQAAPRPANPEIANGLLNLGNSQYYDVLEVDVDGAALKAMDFANNLLRLQSPRHRTADTPESAGVPSLRSAGLSIVRTGRAVGLSQAFQSAAKNQENLEGGSDVTLYAEDLVRGHRIDVWDDQTGRWHSLCQRVGTYRFIDVGKTLNLEDEGFISTAVTQAADGSSDDLYLHESLFHWEGWSLCAPRPGKAINPEDKPEEIENKAMTEFKMETRFAARPGSLPRLRFGMGYRLRARAVDLACNSLPPDAPDTSAAIPSSPSPPFTYRRFEPIATPPLVLRKKTREGESLERLVIRSFNDSPAKDAVQTAEVSERHAAPPKTAQLMAETHGMFDTPAGMDKSAYPWISDKDEGSFQDLEPSETLKLPYLPDPLARGASLRGLPGNPAGQVTQVEFPGDWPDLKPFRILLKEGSGAPQWDAGSRVLTVLLPKAEVAAIRLSSYLAENDLRLMALWKWMAEPKVVLPPVPLEVTPVRPVTPRILTPVQPREAPVEMAPAPAPVAMAPAVTMATPTSLKDLALQGGHWMLTPFREVAFVHAVQQPLLAPSLGMLPPVKLLGATFAILQGKTPIHGKSTLKLDMLAEWEEPVDLLAEPKPRVISGKAHAFEISVPREATEIVFTRQHNKRHEFGDTKYRKVRYHAVATTRFREYFPTEIAQEPKKITRESAVIELDIPNSARPAAPRVVYVIPTFGWEQKETAAGVESKRAGGGLRVYLERTWYSSGDGELLGVVLPPQGAGRASILTAAPQPIREGLKPYVTQWGIDPIWKSSPTPTPFAPSFQNFKKAVETGNDLSLDELPGAAVSAAGHKVDYDEERRLWFCDLEIDPGASYFPFIRLALARYQPKSVPGAHLSRVVLADFAQLTPDRSVALTFDPAKLHLLTVSVSGISYSEAGAGKGPSEVEVTVETRRPDVEGDLAWTPVPDAVFPLTQPSPSVRTVLRGAAEMLAITPQAKVTTWTGQVTLPQPRGSRRFRIVIREYERFFTDEPSGVNLGMMQLPKTERRLVFADAVEI